MKKTLSLFLVLVLALSMCVTALADPHPALTVTKSGGTAVEGVDYEWNPYEDTQLCIKSNGLTVSGTATEGSIAVEASVTDLTIENLNLTCSTGDAIYFYDETNPQELILKGTNTVTATGELGRGIFGYDLTISGSGDLNVTSTQRHGIGTSGSLTLSGTGTMKFDGSVFGIFADGYDNINVPATVGTIISYGNDDDFGAVTWNEGTLSLGSGVTMTADTSYKKAANDITGASYIDDDDACVRAGSNASASPAKSVLIMGAGSVTEYNVWVNGNTRVTSANKDNILGNAGTPTAKYDPTTKTLTLNNYNGKAITSTIGGIQIVLADGTTNTITNTEDYAGISVKGNCTLKGKGDLNITSSQNAICVEDGNLTVDMSGDLTADAEYDGLVSNGDITLSGSGDITVKAKQNGIWAKKNVIISGSGKVTVTADFDAVCINDSGYSLYLNGTGAPISLTAGTGERPRQGTTTGGTPAPGSRMTYKAVYRYADGASPVGGTNRTYYNKVTGAPDTWQVIYDHQSTGGRPYTPTTPVVTSATTADAGIALYGVLSISSLLGMGWIGKRKHNGR